MTSFLCHLKLIQLCYLPNALMLYGNSPIKTQKSNLSSLLVVLRIKLIVGATKNSIGL